MADQQPPQYESAQREQLPGYTGSSNVSVRWHIVNTPAKGVFGSRGISLICDRPLSTDPTAAMQAVDNLGYDLVFVDSAQLEVHPRTPSTGRSGSSSNDMQKTPIIAKVLFAHTNPARASIELTGNNWTRITVDAQDLRPDPLRSQSATINDPSYITMYHEMSKSEILPVCWSIEANSEYRAALDTVESQPVKPESNKWSWKSKLKETIGSKPPTAQETEKSKQQRQNLSSNFTLQDAKSNTYARFSNEFFKDASTFTQTPTYDKTAKQQKSWGHLDLDESYYAFLRSSYSMFEKWSGSDLELLGLLSLIVMLEVNVKINGGSGPSAPFGSIYSPGAGAHLSSLTQNLFLTS